MSGRQKMTGEAGDDTGLHWNGGGKSRQESTDLKVYGRVLRGGRYWAAGHEGRGTITTTRNCPAWAPGVSWCLPSAEETLAWEGR